MDIKRKEERKGQREGGRKEGREKIGRHKRVNITCFCFHLYEMPRTGKSMKQKVGLLSGTGGRENGGGVLTVNGYGVSLASDENVL
jgi:hypothetical protein